MLLPSGPRETWGAAGRTRPLAGGCRLSSFQSTFTPGWGSCGLYRTRRKESVGGDAWTGGNQNRVGVNGSRWPSAPGPRGGFDVVFEEARVHISARLNFDCGLESWSLLGGRVVDAAVGRTGRHLQPHTPEARSSRPVSPNFPWKRRHEQDEGGIGADEFELCWQHLPA